MRWSCSSEDSESERSANMSDLEGSVEACERMGMRCGGGVGSTGGGGAP